MTEKERLGDEEKSGAMTEKERSGDDGGWVVAEKSATPAGGKDHRVRTRETLRKIAALGYELLSPAEAPARLSPKVNGHSRQRRFLTLLWARMLQGGTLLDPAETSLAAVLDQMERLLAQVLPPRGRTAWELPAPREDMVPLERFWQILTDRDFDEIWRLSESAGWLYQYFIEPDLQVFRSAGAPSVRADQLGLRTQQFTPRWIGDFLVQNTLGRLWRQMHPDSRLAQKLPRLVPGDFPDRAPTPRLVRDIKILDPACGCLHLVLRAVELLIDLYREELENAGRPGWPTEPSVPDESAIWNSLVRNNLFGIDIDPLVIEQAALTLCHAARGTFNQPPHLICADALQPDLDATLSAAGFPRAFDVVLLNPPYLDRRDYHPQLRSFMVRHYPDCGRNLYAAFLRRAMDFLAPGGRLGAVTPQTFMFIRSFQALRRLLLSRTVIENLVHTGLNTFDDAVVDCAFYVLRREDHPPTRDRSVGHYFQLTAPTRPEDKDSRLNEMLVRLRRRPRSAISHLYHFRQSDFSALPDHPWVYWTSPRLRRLFRDLPILGQRAQLRQGLATTDNNRFLRFWWEIPRDRVAFDCRTIAQAADSGKKWFPYLKGGEYLKWYGNREHLVNWGQDGREIKAEIIRRYPYLKGKWQWVAKNTEFYFREGITYSYLTSGRFSARYSPPGSIFDVAGSSVFCDDPHLVLAILNSRFCRFALGLINPTVNFQVGDLRRLPVPAGPCDPQLARLVVEAIDVTKSLEAFEETSLDFLAPPPWPHGCEVVRQRKQRLSEIQNRIDQHVFDLYGLTRTDRRRIERQTPPDTIPFELDETQLAARWISYTVGMALGRFAPAESIAHPVLPDEHRGLAGAVRQILDDRIGPAEAQNLIARLSPTGSLAEYLGKPFFDAHFRQYRRRPVYWLIKPQRTTRLAVYYHHLNDPRVRDLFPPRYRGRSLDFDAGIAANMKRFRSSFVLPAWTCRE